MPTAICMDSGNVKHKKKKETVPWENGAGFFFCMEYFTDTVHNEKCPFHSILLP